MNINVNVYVNFDINTTIHIHIYRAQCHPQPYTPQQKQGPNQLWITLNSAFFDLSLGVVVVELGSCGVLQAADFGAPHH